MLSPKKSADASRLVCLVFLCLGPATFAIAPSIPSSTTTVASILKNNSALVQPHVNETAPHISQPKSNSLSEATDMTSAQKYTGGSDVDEIRPTAESHRHKNHTHRSPPSVPIAVENAMFEDLSVPARQNLKSDKFNPTFAAIVAAICITTAVGGYVLLMAWRKVEMDRYGNRQMLVNEDDFGDIQDEDMRHFEMQEMKTVSTVKTSHWKPLSS